MNRKAFGLPREEHSLILMTPFVIAIDGPAASGKGTLAKRIADHYGLAHLDTGALYRAVGLATIRAGGDPSDGAFATRIAESLDFTLLDDPAIRTREAGPAASKVAVHPGVRAALLAFQRTFAKVPPRGAKGAVLDGRDIGTVICPNAKVKLFITASPEVRARRRFLDLCAQGSSLTQEAVLADIRERDARDSGRAAAPLVRAPDAILLDTTDLDIEAAVARALAHVANALSSKTA
jgi:cytidylate kinase